MRAAFAIPGDLATPTGGYVYDRRVMERLPELGVAIEHLPLPGGFPDPTPGDLEAAAHALAGVPHDAVILVDGLALGAMPEAVVRAASAPLVGLVHHPLAFETGLPEARANALRIAERKALAHTRHVIATSETTRDILCRRYDVPSTRIAVAPPGVEPAPRAAGSGGPGVAILAVGAVSPRKNYGMLVAALANLAAYDWTLTIAGSLDRNARETDAIRRAVAEAGLDGRVRLTGALSDEDLARAYDRADLFVVPSLFEGYGMVVAEALARGLPIVATTGGALAEVVPEDAARRTPPGDVAALAAAIGELLGAPELRRRLADAAWRRAAALPRWDDAARIVARVLKTVAA